MNEQMTAREQLVLVVESAEDASGGNPTYVADAVIAHLWERAMQPEVLDEAAKEFHRKWWQGAYSPNEWNEEEDVVKSASRGDAKGIVTAFLTALIGPNPKEHDDE